MYIDGHEHDDVVAYCQKFESWFLTHYATQMYTWDNTGNGEKPIGFNSPDVQDGCFQLITVTHDELTFYANDERKTR